VAEAADTVLDYLYPAQAATFDAQLAAGLAAIPNGQKRRPLRSTAQPMRQR
jgi:hypothetical protein